MGLSRPCDDVVRMSKEEKFFKTWEKGGYGDVTDASYCFEFTSLTHPFDM